MPPTNTILFTAAMAGALSGITGGRLPGSVTSSKYDKSSAVAGAFATALDNLWTLGTLSLLDEAIVNGMSETEWSNRSVDNTTSTNPNTYTNIAQTIIAVVTSARAYYTAQGITPPPFGGGGGFNILQIASDTVVNNTTFTTSLLCNVTLTTKAGSKLIVNASVSPLVLAAAGSALCEIQVDGVRVDGSGRSAAQSIGTGTVTLSTNCQIINLPAGEHTISLYCQGVGSNLEVIPQSLPDWSGASMQVMEVSS